LSRHLAARDWDRLVDVGALGHLLGDEAGARDARQRVEYALVANAAGGDDPDEVPLCRAASYEPRTERIIPASPRDSPRFSR
jgi:hypothetical protein